MATVRINSSNNDNNELTVPIIDKEHIVNTNPSFGKKVANAFIGETARDIGDYIVFEWIIPNMKDGISNFVHFLLYGSTYNRRKRGGGPRYSYDNTPYRSFYQSDYDDYDYDPPRRRRDYERRETRPRYGYQDRVDYRNIILDREIDAQRIVDYLKDRIEEYGKVSRLDLLESVQLPFSHVDECFGWTNPDDIGYIHVPEGYLIDIAEAKDIRGY